MIEEIDAGVQSFDAKANVLVEAHTYMKQQLDAKKRLNEKLRLEGKAIEVQLTR